MAEDKRPPIESFLQREHLEPTPSPEAILKTLKGVKGDKGDAPTVEELEALILPLIPDPIKGDKGDAGKSIEIKDLLPVIENLIPEVEDGKTPSDEQLIALIQPLIPELEKAPELAPRDLIEKINKAKTAKIKRERVEGFDEIEGLAKSANRNVQNILSLGGNRQTAIKVSGTLLGRGIETINFVGATGTKIGDGSEVNVSTGGGTGTVNSIVAGTGINVDSTDPANPIVSATGSSFAVLVPTGTVNGSNTTFTFSTAPKVIVLDNGNIMNKVSSDGTVNWTGTTAVTLAQAPNFNIFGF